MPPKKEKVSFEFVLSKKVFLEISSRSDSSVHRPISPIDSSLNSLSYDELVRHFILLETQYKDDLELLIKLFRNPFQNFSSNVDLIFGCLDEIFDLTSRFLSDLADAKEMRDEILLDESFQNFLEVKKKKKNSRKFLQKRRFRRETNTNVT